MSRVALLALASLLLLVPPSAASSAEAGVCVSAFDGSGDVSCCPYGRVQVRVETKCVIVQGGHETTAAAAPASAEAVGPEGLCAHVSWDPRSGCGVRGCQGRVVVVFDAWCILRVYGSL